MYKHNLVNRKPIPEIILLLAIVILGVMYVRFTWIRIENEQSDKVLQIARSIESTLPVKELGALEAKPGDTAKLQYQVIKNTLKAITRVNPNARFAYIYAKQNGKLYFIADSEPEDSKDYSPPGQEYTEADLAYFLPFKDGNENITAPLTDRWGTWRSVIIPIKDEASGKTIAVFAMDFNARSWDNSLLFEVIQSSVLIAFLLIALLFLFYIKVKNKSLKNGIAQRKQAEDSLLESKNQKAAILRAIPDLLFVFDQNGQYLEVYTEDDSKLLVSRETLIGKNITDLFPPDIATKAIAAFKQSLQSKELVHFFYSLNFNGKTEYYEARIVPASENTILTIVRDITERKVAEEVLFQSRERSRRQRNAIARIAENEVISSDNLTGSFEKLTEEITVAIQVEHASIWLLSDDKTALRCIALFENSTKKHSSGAILYSADYPRYFEAINNESRISAPDAQNDERTSEFTNGYLVPLGISSMLDAGIYAEGELMGMVCMEHTAEKRTWYSDEESFASTIASIVGQTLANTKRKLTEDALRTSEDKYRNDFMFLHSIIESPTDIIIFALDKNYCYTAFTKFHKETIKQIWGVDIQIGMNMLDIISDTKDRQKAKRNFDRALLGEYFVLTEEYGNEKLYRTFYENYYSSIKNSNESIVGVSVFVIDITQRRSTEEALYESEEKYRLIAENTSDGILLFDADNIIRYVSPAYLRQIGNDETEELNRTPESVYSIIHRDDRDAVFAEIYKAIESKKSELVYSYRVKHKEGHYFWREDNAKFKYNSSGNYDGAYVICRDITERRLNEEALRMSEDKYRTMIEFSNDLIWMLDTNGNFTFFNEITSKTTGLILDEWKGKSFVPLIIKEDLPMIMDIFQKNMNGTACNYELRFKKPDESILTISVNTSPIYISGKIEGIVSFGRDITERKQAENAIKEALVKAESGNRLKTAFMHNISHEIRTPLNGILGFSNLIAQPDITNDEKKRFFLHLEKSSNRLLKTITDYMDISLIASGNMEVALIPINLQSIFHILFDKFQPLCANKNLRLKLEIPNETEGFMLFSDLALFQKIMTHLLDNAIKFTTEGEITFGYVLTSSTTAAGSITQTDCTVGERSRTPELEFFVKDTGVGIKPEAISLIFESFKQEELSHIRGHEGSGLGLSIAKGLVQLLGGQIHVTSIKGAGSRFSFTMPDSKIQLSVKPEVKTNNLPYLDKPVILIAEDDESNLFYLEAILKEKLVSIISAINGKEAVDQCRQHPEISLVLMDIKMPVMDGLEATREIKLFRRDLPIIACTAFALSGDTKMLLDAGCDDYVSKPVNKKILLGKLEKYGVIL